MSDIPEIIYIADQQGGLSPPFYSEREFITAISHKYYSEAELNRRIEEACEKQREACAEAVKKYFDGFLVSDAILSARAEHNVEDK